MTRRTAKFLICPVCGQPTYTRTDYARVRLARLIVQLKDLIDQRGRSSGVTSAIVSKQIAGARASIKRWKRELQHLGEGI